MTKVLAFVVVTAAVVALAGPIPTIVTGVLVLILSSIILLHPDTITNLLQTTTDALSPAKKV